MKELIEQLRTAAKNVYADIDSLKSPKSLTQDIRFSPKTVFLKNNFSVRMVQGQKHHVPDLLSIEKKSYNGTTPWGKRALEKDISHSRSSLYYVLYANEQPIGFLGCRLEKLEIHITNIAVIPEFQRLGAGTILLEELEHFAYENLILTITLEVRASNNKAQELYVKRGFKPLRVMKNYYHDDGEDALEMFLSVPIKRSEKEYMENADAAGE